MTGARLDGVDAEREAQLLSRVIDTISAGLDLGRMLQGVARLVTEATGTDVCFVHLLDERGRTRGCGAPHRPSTTWWARSSWRWARASPAGWPCTASLP